MKRYPAYKDSGVEWLGEVPKGWEVLSSRRLFRQIRESAGETDEQLSATQKSGVLPQRLFMEQQDQKVVLALSGLGNFKHIEAGDFVISLRSFQGGIEYSAYTGCVSPAYTVLRPTKGLDDNFYRYLLKSNDYISFLQSVTTGIRDGRNVSFDQFGLVNLPVPPLPEQRAIADFLDRETSKIDALVEEQRRLIALLAEKRQAVISHAVTKGLNPTAPLKPSGIDWLGDIPEEWEVMPLRRLCALNPSKSEARDRSRDEEVSFLPMEAVGEDGSLDLSRTRAISDVETGYTYIRENDVTFAKITPCFENGKGAIMTNLIGGIAFGTTELTVLRPLDPRIMPAFLYFITASSVFRHQGEGSMYGAGGQKRVPDEFARTFPIALPPKNEQVDIVDFIRDALTRFDALTDAATSAITLLQERRATLISAAVTGKIDVREAEAPVVAQRQSMEVSAMVAGIVIAKHGRQPDHGRVWLQKMLFMAQTHANIDGIGGNYLRAANGPLDIGLQDHVEADLSAANAIRVTREPGEQGAYRYDFIGDASQLRADLAAVIGDRMDGFLRLMDLLGAMGTKQIEAVATLYAAWNDFLINGKVPSDADLIHEVLENWHPAKKERLSKQYLADQLGWMRRQDIVPSGTGGKTYTDRLL